LLLNKKNILICAVILSTALISCKKEVEPPPHKLFEEPALVLKTAKEVLNQEVAFSSSGYFDSDTLKSIVAGVEVSTSSQMGVQFFLINWVDGTFQKTYSTGILEGSFTQCTVDKIKFSDFRNELIYFNSESYFMGSAGGEVFAYIIDLKDKKTYSAHLTAASKGLVMLELSDNIKTRMMKNFFIGYFKRDYPNLAIMQTED
jgi:hypothetical protein